MGANSVTQILPETSSSETTIGTQLAFSSLINIQGLDIEMQSGSLLYAPGANVPSASSSGCTDPDRAGTYFGRHVQRRVVDESRCFAQFRANVFQ